MVDEFDDVPYLSLAELLENTERLDELPLFVIQETNESLPTPILSARVTQRLSSRSSNLWKQNQELGPSNQASFVKVQRPQSKEQQNSDSFFKITSITQNQMGSSHSKDNTMNQFSEALIQGNMSQSKKSHFSPENNNILENFSEAHRNLQEPKISNYLEHENQNLKKEITRQSVQIQEMAKVQQQILSTLKRQSEQMTKEYQPGSKPQKSQFQEQQIKNDIFQSNQEDRFSRNMLLDSNHYQMGKSKEMQRDSNQVDPRNYSVFNIFQKRGSNDTQLEHYESMYKDINVNVRQEHSPSLLRPPQVQFAKTDQIFQRQVQGKGTVFNTQVKSEATPLQHNISN